VLVECKAIREDDVRSIGETAVQPLRDPREAVLEELAGTAARLLRAQQTPLPGQSELYEAVVLTFDRARLIITPSGRGDELALRLDPGDSDVLRPDLAAAAQDSGEEEPWWRVLGNPLHRAWASSDPQRDQAALELQFRADDANPRVVVLELAEGGIRIHLRPALSSHPPGEGEGPSPL
jgi:hypothetical protein